MLLQSLSIKNGGRIHNSSIPTLPKAFLNYPHVLFGSIEITIHKSFYQQTDQHTSKVSRTTTKDFFQKLALINTNGLSKDGLLFARGDWIHSRECRWTIFWNFTCSFYVTCVRDFKHFLLQKLAGNNWNNVYAKKQSPKNDLVLWYINLQ